MTHTQPTATTPALDWTRSCAGDSIYAIDPAPGTKYVVLPSAKDVHAVLLVQGPSNRVLSSHSLDTTEAAKQMAQDLTNQAREQYVAYAAEVSTALKAPGAWDFLFETGTR